MKNHRIRILAGITLIAVLSACGKKKDEVVTLTPAIDTVTESAPEGTAVQSPDVQADVVQADAEQADAEQPEENTLQSETTEEAEESAALSVPILQENTGISFANLTGRDIVKLQISFNAGDFGTLEVLGERRLYDGDQYRFQNSALDGLYGVSGLKMSVTATAKDATVMLFPEVDIMDLSHAAVILCTTKEGYAIRLQ